MKKRTPEQIKDLYERIRAQKKKEGVSYTQADFAKDLGYSRRETISEIFNGVKGHSPQVDIILDYMERDLNDTKASD